MTRDLTTIKLSKAVREQLKKLGKKGETYGDIIRRLIGIAESSIKEEKSSIEATKISERDSEMQQIANIENLFKDIHEELRRI